MQNGKEICCIPDCDQPVQYVHLQVCSACYSGLARWRGRPAAAKRLQMARYVRLQSRMDFIMENPRHHPKKVARRDDLDGGRKQ